MSRRNASYAEVSTFAHATEDFEKVRSAILKILPEQLTQRVGFTKTNMLGHHGNPIVELKICITNRRDAYEVLHRILSRLSPLDAMSLDEELAKHIDARHHFYLRLDKQRAFLDEVVLASDDAISLVFHLKASPRSLDELKTSLSTDGKHGGGIDAS